MACAKFIFAAQLVALFAASASAQNCGIIGATGPVITAQPLNETSPVGTLAWIADTFNVTGAASVPSPTLKYITGLRYATRYEYLTSAEFPNFTRAERAVEMVREVVFTCSDGSQRPFTFIFPVEDENNNAPEFNAVTYNFTASLAQLNSTAPINLNITVSDADVHIKNANVLIRSSNPFVTLLNIPLFENEIPDVAYVFRSELILHKDNLSAGTYQIILTADDGRFSALALLNLVLTP